MSDGNTRNLSSSEVKQENKHGIEKTRVQVQIGSQVVETSKRVHNPITDRTEDMTRLSEDGYVLPFLALWYQTQRPYVVDLSDGPLTFDLDKWDVEKKDGAAVLHNSKGGGDDE